MENKHADVWVYRVNESEPIKNTKKKTTHDLNANLNFFARFGKNSVKWIGISLVLNVIDITPQGHLEIGNVFFRSVHYCEDRFHIRNWFP